MIAQLEKPPPTAVPFATLANDLLIDPLARAARLE
jgi:hypothetical protein